MMFSRPSEQKVTIRVSGVFRKPVTYAEANFCSTPTGDTRQMAITNPSRREPTAPQTAS